MLFLVSGTLWCHRNNQADGGDLVVTIGSGEHHRQRSTALIDEEVDLRSEFAPVGGVLAHFLASQRSWGVLGVNSLPLPADPAALPGIVLDHPPPELLEYARPSPPLETLLDDARGDPEPIAMESFPLASGPQHVPDGVGGGSVGSPRSATSAIVFLSLGQVLLEFPPQWPRHPEVVHFRRCGSLSHTAHLLSRMVMVAIPLSEGCVFVQGSQVSSRIESKVELSVSALRSWRESPRTSMLRRAASASNSDQSASPVAAASKSRSRQRGAGEGGEAGGTDGA